MFDRNNDKIQSFSLRIIPDPMNYKECDSERIFNFQAVSGIEIEVEQNEKIKIGQSLLIDYIEGYFEPGNPKISFIENSFDNCKKNLLPLFSKSDYTGEEL